tara:strand:- start:14392 stop:14721 length:330 start_codon:yes stop_codon:yes gene_type:complete
MTITKQGCFKKEHYPGRSHTLYTYKAKSSFKNYFKSTYYSIYKIPSDIIEKYNNTMVNDKNICSICYDNPINMLAKKCLHISTCEKCTSHLDKCPYCRVETDFKKVFIC